MMTIACCVASSHRPLRRQNWIDLAFAPKHLPVVLRSLLLIVLLFGVVGSLSGPVAAEPGPPCPHKEMAQSAAMDGMADCCPDEGKSGKDSVPCKDMAAVCMAMAGCATVTLHGGADLPLGAVAGDAHSWFRQKIPVLYGLSVPPDPYPPSRFG